MKRKSDRFRRWASLSALASAALTASAGSGEAAIIYHGVSGAGLNANVPLPGGNQVNLSGFGSGFFTDTASVRTAVGPKGNLKAFAEIGFRSKTEGGGIYLGGLSFRGANNSIALAKKGQTFQQVGAGIASIGRLGSFHSRQATQSTRVAYAYGPRSHNFPLGYWSSYQSGGPSFRRKQRVRTLGPDRHNGSFSITFQRYFESTQYNFADYGKQYALFRFDIGEQVDYGWLELELGNSSGHPPFIKIAGYAYDTTGKPIKAGEVPEPQHLPAALGALALGAIGVREWRKKRNTVP